MARVKDTRTGLWPISLSGRAVCVRFHVWTWIRSIIERMKSFEIVACRRASFWICALLPPVHKLLFEPYGIWHIWSRYATYVHYPPPQHAHATIKIEFIPPQVLRFVVHDWDGVTKKTLFFSFFLSLKLLTNRSRYFREESFELNVCLRFQKIGVATSYQFSQAFVSSTVLVHSTSSGKSSCFKLATSALVLNNEIRRSKVYSLKVYSRSKRKVVTLSKHTTDRDIGAANASKNKRWSGEALRNKYTHAWHLVFEWETQNRV